MATRLGTSQSAVSQTVRRLEARLGLRLLTRTTRSVAPTEAGERLLGTLGPAFDQVAGGLAALTELRDKPSGTIRLTTSEHAAETLLWPVLERLASDYPDVNLEVTVDAALTNIVSERFDARFSQQRCIEQSAGRGGKGGREPAMEQLPLALRLRRGPRKVLGPALRRVCSPHRAHPLRPPCGGQNAGAVRSRPPRSPLR